MTATIIASLGWYTTETLGAWVSATGAVALPRLVSADDLAAAATLTCPLCHRRCTGATAYYQGRAWPLVKLAVCPSCPAWGELR